jgi:hypothetical protein
MRYCVSASLTTHFKKQTNSKKNNVSQTTKDKNSNKQFLFTLENQVQTCIAKTQISRQKEKGLKVIFSFEMLRKKERRRFN